MDHSKDKNSPTYICSFPDCHVAYNKAWKLEAHLCRHTGERPFQCDHDGCGKGFVTKYHLARHILSHSGEKRFRCTETDCTEAFTTTQNLKKHLSRKHKPGRLYKCSYEGCGEEFRKNSQLKTHECQHTKLLPFLCGFEGCGRRFPTSQKLRRHEKVHKGYPCPEEGCAFVGKTWTEAIKHRKELHRVAVPHKCDQCDKSFGGSWFLRQHQRVHLKERLVFKCPREACDRSYTTLFNLQSHIRSFHEELRPFVCPHEACNKTFAMKQSLQRHLVKHDPLRRKQEKKPRSVTKHREKKPRKIHKRSLASHLSGYNSDCDYKFDILDSNSAVIESGQNAFPNSTHSGQYIEVRTA
ncbi:hypothetical protein ACEWY4_016989 [Coilia grayii]|uniref:Transcription factor IIIA n=1 Tax=Coilia grayii TaxID=363190 RepID=A0ABD1JPF9_9TELE